MNLNDIKIETLALLWETSAGNASLITQIEDVFQQKLNNNTDYSKEFLYHLTINKRKVFTANFIPTSEAFKKLGKYIVVLELSLTEEEEKQLLINLYSKPSKHTYGEVTAKILTENSFQIIKFNTNEILSIYC